MRIAFSTAAAAPAPTWNPIARLSNANGSAPSTSTTKSRSNAGTCAFSAPVTAAVAVIASNTPAA